MDSSVSPLFPLKGTSVLKINSNLKSFVNRMVICNSNRPDQPIGGLRGGSKDPWGQEDTPVFEQGIPETNFGTGTVWSDHLIRQKYEHYNKCCQEVWGDHGQYFHCRTPDEISRFLSLYLDRSVKVFKIIEGCNQATGYEVWSFHFAYLEPRKEK